MCERLHCYFMVTLGYVKAMPLETAELADRVLRVVGKVREVLRDRSVLVGTDISKGSSIPEDVLTACARPSEFRFSSRALVETNLGEWLRSKGLLAWFVLVLSFVVAGLLWASPGMAPLWHHGTIALSSPPPKKKKIEENSPQ